MTSRPAAESGSNRRSRTTGADQRTGERGELHPERIDVVSPDPRSLRGLAHPLRLHLLGLLRADGPATASQLAARTGQSSGATSYHLRQLAAYGFVVEDTGRGLSLIHISEPTRPY
jgi:predicted transcriptional regulator